jgi:transposase InsO family protein
LNGGHVDRGQDRLHPADTSRLGEEGGGRQRQAGWRSFEAVEFATLEWVDWFNNRRLLEPIGNIPPAEAEQRYYAMLDEPAMAA